MAAEISVFARNLRFLRKRRQQSQAEFALALGLWEETLIRFEQGRAEPDLATLVAIADALQAPVDYLLRNDLERRFQQLDGRSIRLILLDVDGTLTDGGMYYSESGDQFKRFQAKDGLAIHRLITRHGVQFGLISAGYTEQLLRRRAAALGIERVYCGTRPKIEVAEEWLAGMGLTLQQTAFIGDDLNDLPLLRRAGFSACPADAAPQVKAAAHLVLARKGGEGCVREFIEEVLGADLL